MKSGGFSSTWTEALTAETDIAATAHEVLDAVDAAIPSAASALCLWDPLRQRHVTLANHDYPEHVLDHLNTWFIDRDPLFEAMKRTGSGALRWCDFPEYRTSYSVTEIFRPAGFDEGLSGRLVTSAGVYAGTIHVNSDSRAYPRDSDVALIDSFRAEVARLLDISARPALVAGFLAPGATSWLVDRHGHRQPLFPDAAGYSTSELVLVEQISAAVARTWPIRPVERMLRWQHDSTWHLVRVIPAPPRYRGAAPAAIVAVHTEPLPFGLTPRELDVLTLLTHGLTSAQIADRLVISERTAAHHVEHAMAKLGVTNRIACASMAVRFGLVSGRLEIADPAPTLA
ncbi:helix-turn-helix transcriptional regulator [Nocardia sp. NPDC052254]|uniref:helix-turn-helix transcriptional regulator n=1 Tax=Nocardia sp. NPDC052254 TaxID=3155681 RepID=UPI003440765B